MNRVAIVALFHETNTFARQRTNVDAFRAYGWLEGAELVTRYAGTRTVVGGFVDGLAGVDARPVGVFGAYATPSGLVPSETFDAIVAEMCTRLADAEPFDAVLLELHGALVVDGRDDAEAELCQRLRALVGDRAMVAVTDLHANMTPDRLAALDALVGYRTNPHVDTYECGVDAARLLDRTRTARPTMAHARVPVLAPAIAQRTSQLPLLRVLSRARELERRHRLLDVTVHAGYAYADVPHAGLSVTATSDRANGADAEVAEELARLAWAHREEFRVRLPAPPEAFAEAARLATTRGSPGPVAIADTGDNINGGAPGDNTALLRVALDTSGVRTALTMRDATAVAAAARAGVGARIRLHCADGSDPTAGVPTPVEVDAEVRWVGDGTFVNTGPMAYGAQESMGPAATVRVGTTDIVLQSRPLQPNDPEAFRCAGVDPTHVDVLVLKGASAVRAGWAGIVRAFVDAGTPGVTDCDLTRLPYRCLADTVWPLTDPPIHGPQVYPRLG